ncbi:MAG: ATP-dependent Clp protease ATP-binding subunit ClpA, partial [Alphaproteobacteria bacterium]|nr:ATP-dependent Clp protease ATP-binding subunit ClpA [Alphaproteobacteria bacterium]
MLSSNLEQTLHRALVYANTKHHEFATLEHLLLALVEDPDAVAVMRACDVNIELLKQELTQYINSELQNLIHPASGEAKPTSSFQRVLQRAAIHVQSSGREEV